MLPREAVQANWVGSERCDNSTSAATSAGRGEEEQYGSMAWQYGHSIPQVPETEEHTRSRLKTQ